MEDRTFSDFYDAFSNCAVTQEAIKDGKISSRTTKLLDRYVRKAYGSKPIQPIKTPLPPPFDELLPLQDKTGVWTDLNAVLTCLCMPKEVRIGQNLQMEEEATIFAVAAIRQRPELFNLLGDAHDNGVKWIKSQGLVTIALELLYDFREPDYRKKYKDSKDRIGISKIRVSEIGDLEEISLDKGPGSISAHSSICVTEDGRYDDLTVGESPRRVVNKEITAAEEHYTDLLRNMDVILAQVVKNAELFDKVCAELKLCCKRTIDTFFESQTFGERNTSFDEMTCLLADGQPPLPGVSGWRSRGCSGFRSTCVALLCSVDDLATCRLDVDEAYKQWKGRPPIEIEGPSNLAESRWTFTWAGQDLVMSVLHSLDFLQRNECVRDWFGRPFSFTANPLSLPLNGVDLFNNLNMEPKVTEMLAMRPFRRIMCGTSNSEIAAFRQREYVSRWQVSFELECTKARLSSLWPISPDVVNIQRCENLYRAIMVLFVKGRLDIMRGVGIERLNQSNDALRRSHSMYTNRVSSSAGGLSKWRGTFDISSGRDQKINTSTSVESRVKLRKLPTLKHRPTEGYKTRAVLEAEMAQERRKADEEAAAISAAAAAELQKYLESDDAKLAVLPQDTQMELKLTVTESVKTAKKLKIKKGKKKNNDKNNVPIKELDTKMDEFPKYKDTIAKKSGNTSALLETMGIGNIKDKVSRASFPSDIKLTRKVASPKKKEAH